jgi:MFS family permease
MDAALAGYIYGTTGSAFGILGVAAWPALVRMWTIRGRKDALVTVFAAATTMGWISFATVGLTRSTAVLVGAIATGDFFQAAVAVFAPLLIQQVTPGRLRARAMSVYLMAASLGLAYGPALAAFLGNRFFRGPFAIGSGVAVVALTMGPLASLAIWLLHKPYRTVLDRAEAREAVS